MDLETFFFDQAKGGTKFVCRFRPDPDDPKDFTILIVPYNTWLTNSNMVGRGPTILIHPEKMRKIVTKRGTHYTFVAKGWGGEQPFPRIDVIVLYRLNFIGVHETEPWRRKRRRKRPF